MNKQKEKYAQRERRDARARKRIRGTQERPRLTVYRSLANIYAQIINDDEGRTLCAASSLDPTLRTAVVYRERQGSTGRRSDVGQDSLGQGHQEGRIRPRSCAVSRTHRGLGRSGPQGRTGLLSIRRSDVGKQQRREREERTGGEPMLEEIVIPGGINRCAKVIREVDASVSALSS